MEAAIVSRALADDAFRQKFLADPKAALEEVTGGPVPAGLVIETYGDKAGAMQVKVSVSPAGEEGAITDAQLEGVAGGGFLPYVPTQEGLVPLMKLTATALLSMPR